MEKRGPQPLRPARKDAVLKAFEVIWSDLFTSPVHLDSALSKRPRHIKTILAQIVPPILLRPASVAEAVGVGVPPGEPWNLTPEQLKHWRPARLMAEKLYGSLVSGGVKVNPVLDDFPPRMIEEWERTWGKASLPPLAGTLATEAPLGLRAARKTGAAPLLKGLSADGRLGVKAELSDLSPMGVRLAGYAPVLGTDWYKKGAFEIQDEGSQLMAFFALWPELFAGRLQRVPGLAKSMAPSPLPKDPPAWNVVDACAGAGGKSLALADALGGKGRVYAYDTSAVKLQALRRRATHAGLNNIQAVALTRDHEADTIGKFRRRAQVVLVDAPCTGWGVLRRNPDIKWRQTSEAVDRMPPIQARLLAQYSDLVAPGGRLVYGVCTFRRAETVEIVTNFLKEHPDFEATEGGYLGPGPSDGFFMQAFIRTAKTAGKGA